VRYGVFVAVIIALMLGVPSWEATMIGAIVIVASGVLTEREAINNMNMDIIMLYVGVVVMGNALGQTGAADMLGKGLASILGHTSNGYLIGAAFYIVAFLMTSVLYNRAVTTVLEPLAIMSFNGLRSARTNHPVCAGIHVFIDYADGNCRCANGYGRWRIQPENHFDCPVFL
jgi:di/tricarboxylate transporter